MFLVERMVRSPFRSSIVTFVATKTREPGYAHNRGRAVAVIRVQSLRGRRVQIQIQLIL